MRAVYQPFNKPHPSSNFQWRSIRQTIYDVQSPRFPFFFYLIECHKCKFRYRDISPCAVGIAQLAIKARNAVPTDPPMQNVTTCTLVMSRCCPSAVITEAQRNTTLPRHSLCFISRLQIAAADLLGQLVMFRVVCSALKSYPMPHLCPMSLRSPRSNQFEPWREDFGVCPCRR